MTQHPGLARRTVLGAGLVGTALGAGTVASEAAPIPAGSGLDAGGFGLVPGRAEDQTAVLQRALVAAARDGRALQLGPGRYRVGGVSLPAGTCLIGSASTRLVQAGGRPVLAAKGGGRIVLQGFAVEGDRQAARTVPLLSLEDVADLQVSGLRLEAASGTALRLERCGGAVEDNRIARADIAVFSLDATGLAIRANVIEQCANNGIQVWRSAKGYDGTQILANRIAGIRTASGGSGENGNGINIFRAGNVLVANNTIRDCAFSAVRNNAGDDVQILGNSCADLGEVALFAEFGFEGCVIANNLVDKASIGVSITNFNENGRLAVASGNILRNLFRRPDALSGIVGQGVGIAVEADAAVTGNVIEAAAFAGISIGYGPHLRDVACTGNVVRQSGVGVAVSVAPGAGAAQIANNLFSRCAAGNVVGYAWDKAATSDLAKGGAERFAHLSILNNTLR